MESAGVTERSVRVDGRETRVLERGDGPPVVLVHGLGLSADLWVPHLERVAAAGYRVIAADVPGFGATRGRTRGPGVDAAAAWLDALASSLGLDRPAWVGHSVSTQHLLRLAVTRPERVGALVLAAPTGRRGRHPFRQIGGLLRTAVRERPALVAAVIRRYVVAPVSTLTSWVRSLGHDAAVDAPLVQCPSLIVLGADDPVVPERFGHRLARLIPDAGLVRIEGAAHAVALDPVDPFCDALLAFLSRRYRPDSTS